VRNLISNKGTKKWKTNTYSQVSLCHKDTLIK
jgi:hypothetical protein